MYELNNALLTLDLQFFAEEQPQLDGSETNPNGEQPEQTNLESPETPTAEVKTYTQDEINDIIAKRLERERKKFSDYDTLKAKASEYEAELEAKRLAEMSEKERAEAIAEQYKAQLAELQAQVEAKETAIREQAIKNEFIKVATSANIIDLDGALKLSDLSAVSIDESGAVVGVDNVISTLVEHKPYLVAKKAPQPIGQATNAGTSQYNDKPAEQLLAEAFAKARKSGRIEDRVAYDKLKRELSK